MSPFLSYGTASVIRTRKTIVVTTVAGLFFASCKQRPPTEPQTASLRHELGATSIEPVQPLSACFVPTEYLDAAGYFSKIAQRLMAENPKTFKGVYAPDQFCIHARNNPDLNAAASTKTRSLAFDTGLLHMADDQVDADIAMVIAHELAHITLQHGARDPLVSELPEDVDRGELDRRLRVKAVYLDKKDNLRKSIAINGRTDGIFVDYLWLTSDLAAIIDGLKPTLSTKDDAAVAHAVAVATALKTRFAGLFNDENGKSDPIIESNFMIQSRELIRTLTEDLPTVKAAIKHAGTCAQPRKVTYCLGQLASYHNLRVQPIATQLMTASMPLADNPEAYPPYAQWMEQQADEVGYEFFLRAGFKPERYETFFKAVMKKKPQPTADECLKSMNDVLPTAPPRLDDTDDYNHPSSCFRLYDINITETLKHHSVYDELAAKATITNLPDATGDLSDLRKNYPASP